MQGAAGVRFDQQLAAMATCTKRHGCRHRAGNLQRRASERRCSFGKKAVDVLALVRVRTQQHLMPVRRKLHAAPFVEQRV